MLLLLGLPPLLLPPLVPLLPLRWWRSLLWLF
jgi:hypothetical protein